MTTIEVTHSHRSELRSPRRFIATLSRDLRNCNALAVELFRRDFSARYRESFLGVIWAFVPPVLMAVSFTFAAQSRLISVKPTGIPYVAYVILGVCLWQVFAEAVNGPMQAFNQAKTILTKVQFPREALFLSKFYDIAFNFAFKLLLIAGVFVVYRISIGPSALLFPLSVLLLIVLGFSMGFFLVPISVLIPDVQRAVASFLAYAMFLTPVVYPMPESGLLSTIVRLNPVTSLVVTSREFLTGAALSMPWEFACVGASSILLFVLSWLFCRLSMPFLIERLGS